MVERAKNRDLDGILLLDKPIGISSNKTLQRAKNFFRAKKAGHTGNLDLEASGLLPVCFGETTKLSRFLLDSDKHYACEFTFGRSTTTGDAAGETLEERPVNLVDGADLKALCRQFEGEQDQIPPMYSALKHKGQPLYKFARRGIHLERKPRSITINNFSIISLFETKATFEITCSRGTYIRTIAHDFGERLGCGAHVSKLRRLGVGPFKIDQAVTLSTIESEARNKAFLGLDKMLLPSDTAVEHLQSVYFCPDGVKSLRNGRSVKSNELLGDGPFRLYDSNNNLFGIGRVDQNGLIAPRRIFREVHSEAI